MKIRLLLLLLFLSSTSLKAQTNLDSLHTIWQDETQTDSTRTYAFKAYIGSGFLLNKPDTAFVLAENLIAFAEEKQFIMAKGEAYSI